MWICVFRHAENRGGSARALGACRSTRSALAALLVGGLPILLAAGCDKPETTVIVDNRYRAAGTPPLTVYRAFWQAVSFADAAIPPGSSSDPQESVAASPNTAYVVLAPGWDPQSSDPPTSLVVMQSRAGFELHVNNTLHIPVDDTTFVGNCASGSFLSQAQADFITRRIFPNDFATSRYDAATCTTIPFEDAGAP